MVLDLTRRAVFLSQGVPVQNRTTNRRYLSQKWVILWTYLLGILGWLQSNLPLIDKTNLILLNFVSNDFPSQIDDRISGFPIWFWTWSQKNDWAECHKSGLNRINRRSLLCIQSLVQSMARASNFDDDDFSTADLFSTAHLKFYCQFYRRFSVAVEVAVDMYCKLAVGKNRQQKSCPPNFEARRVRRLKHTLVLKTCVIQQEVLKVTSV